MNQQKSSQMAMRSPFWRCTLVDYTYIPAKKSHHTFTTNQYVEGISSDKTSLMTITYFAKVVGISPVFSEKLAHIVPTKHRSWWLLVALYKNWQAVT